MYVNNCTYTVAVSTSCATQFITTIVSKLKEEKIIIL